MLLLLQDAERAWITETTDGTYLVRIACRDCVHSVSEHYTRTAAQATLDRLLCLRLLPHDCKVETGDA